MKPEEKAELAGLLEEKEFRSEPRHSWSTRKHIDINGVEHNIRVLRLRLRPDLIVRLVPVVCAGKPGNT
jgi:hypothetical protein